jgi:hypothetical protein
LKIEVKCEQNINWNLGSGFQTEIFSLLRGASVMAKSNICKLTELVGSRQNISTDSFGDVVYDHYETAKIKR